MSIDSIFTWLYNIMYQNDILALVSSFGWGVLSVMLSPCHLAALPLILAYIADRNNSGDSALKSAFLFALGILITILIIGLITAFFGGLIGDTGSWGNYVTGLFLILAGLYFLGVLNFTGIRFDSGSIKLKGGLLALALGLTAGLALGPCTFAFMAPVFTYGFQLSQTKPIISFSLFLAYGLGHCAVILGAGMLSAKIQRYLSWTGSSFGITIFRKTCGVLVIAGGIYIITSSLI